MDSYIESKLPIILTLGDHIITIIGHSLGREGRKKYVVYDDSGEFFRQKDLDGEILKKGKSFVDLVYWEDIEKLLGKDGYMIVPEMEKVFVPFPNIKKNYERFIQEIFKQDGFEIKSERFLIIDNSILKKYLKDDKKVTIPDEDKSRVEKLMKSNLPHYLWWCEIKMLRDEKELTIGVVADPTKHLNSSGNMFYDVRLQLHESVSLLAV